MSRYLFDTNHASLLFRQLPSIIAAMKAHDKDQVFLCRPSAGELWYVAYNSRRRDENIEDMRRFIDGFNVLEFTPAAAEEFGVIKAELRRLGKPIPAIDVQIAAIARVMNLILLTDDAHFQSIEGLILENWLRP